MLFTAGKWSASIGNLDPNHLTNNENMKGIKHFVEYLSLLEELVTFGNATVADWAMEKVQEAVQVRRDSSDNLNTLAFGDRTEVAFIVFSRVCR